MELILIGSNLPAFAILFLLAGRFKNFQRPLRFFSLFAFVTAMAQSISLFLWFRSSNNMPVLHVFLPLSYVLLIEFYRSILNTYVNGVILRVSAAGFVIFSITNTLFFQDVYTFNSTALTVYSVLVVVLSLTTYVVLLNRVVKEQLRETIRGLSWINSGLFVYHASNLLLFYFSKFIMYSLSFQMSQYTWVLHSFFFVIMYVCFFIGLWKSPKQ